VWPHLALDRAHAEPACETDAAGVWPSMAPARHRHRHGPLGWSGSGVVMGVRPCRAPP
jgi:hypothetical protein